MEFQFYMNQNDRYLEAMKKQMNWLVNLLQMLVIDFDSFAVVDVGPVVLVVAVEAVMKSLIVE